MFHVTYEIVTPESAEQGDVAEHGFVDEHGYCGELSAVEDQADFAMSLRQALNVVAPAYDCGHWFEEADGRRDYRSGAEERRALHPPRSITPASYQRLKRLIKAR